MVFMDRGRSLGNAGDNMLQALGLRGDLAQAMITNLDYLDSISGMLDSLGAAFGNKEAMRRQIVEIDRVIATVLENVLKNNGQIVASLSMEDGPPVGGFSGRVLKQMAVPMYRTANNQAVTALKEALERRAMVMEQLLRDSPMGGGGAPSR